jgi:hypothetical protein
MINAEVFWDKVRTKSVLVQHGVTIRPAETLAHGLRAKEIPDFLQTLNEPVVVKPHKDRQGHNILLLEPQPVSGTWRLPTGHILDERQIVERLADPPTHLYLVEERFYPPASLKRFAWYEGTGPLFRLLFDERKGFIVGAMYSASAIAKGFAQILVGGFALWFDGRGVIRPPEEMAPPCNARTGTYLSRTYAGNEFDGLQIQGMEDVIKHLMEKLWPNVEAAMTIGRQRLRWGVDLMFDAMGNPRIAEVNHSPGCQMVKWCGWASEPTIRGEFKI